MDTKKKKCPECGEDLREETRAFKGGPTGPNVEPKWENRTFYRCSNGHEFDDNDPRLSPE